MSTEQTSSNANSVPPSVRHDRVGIDTSHLAAIQYVPEELDMAKYLDECFEGKRKPIETRLDRVKSAAGAIGRVSKDKLSRGYRVHPVDVLKTLIEKHRKSRNSNAQNSNQSGKE